MVFAFEARGACKMWSRRRRSILVNTREAGASGNPRVDESIILAGHFQATRSRFAASKGLALILHDTTDLSYLWESSKPQANEVIESFTIVTTTPNELVSKLHDRMPVILDRAGIDRWLDPKASAKSLAGVLKPYPAALMTY